MVLLLIVLVKAHLFLVVTVIDMVAPVPLVLFYNISNAPGFGLCAGLWWRYYVTPLTSDGVCDVGESKKVAL